MDNNIIEIGRACNYYRPYYLHGKSLRKILFFSNGKILFSTDGWLEDCHKDVEKIKIFSPIKKRKVNLNLKQNFLLGECLYIYVDGKSVVFENKGEFLLSKTDNELYFSNKYMITLFDKKIEMDSHSRIEKTKFGKKVNKISKELECNKIDIPPYVLSDLLKIYKLVKIRN